MADTSDTSRSIPSVVREQAERAVREHLVEAYIKFWRMGWSAGYADGRLVTATGKYDDTHILAPILPPTEESGGNNGGRQGTES